ncbi:MAG: trypsin-like peptidase domain-containing protein [Oscillospiraceae bacterium]
MKRKLTSLIILISTIISFSVYAEEAPAVYVDGTQVQTEAFIKDGVTYVPLRAVSEKLGASVGWSEEENRVDITANSEENAIRNAIDIISPSVVAIVGNYMADTTATYQDKYAEGIAHGTGIILTSGGEILTNAHVVKDLTSIVVILANGEGYEGRIKYIDEKLDLAVVKIEKLGLPVAKFADENSLVIGKKVIAVGTPVNIGLRNSVSLGIISGVNRSVSSEYTLIQTDAAVNPGNSGGPLVNLSGEVVGINSSGYSAIGIEGMNFAIPITNVKYAINQFETYGKINRPNFEAELEQSWTAKLGLPTSSGLIVKSIVNGGAAAAAGVLVGDAVIAVDGAFVNSDTDWHEKMKDYIPGSTATLGVMRDGNRIDLNITFG